MKGATKGAPRALVVMLPLLLVTTACRSGDGASTGTNATATATASSAPPPAIPSAILALHMRRLDGTDEPLSDYAGKVLLFVNTASECGYTPQYEGLQALHAHYQARGFSVLGFPSNDFGEQEPGSSAEIAAFCETHFGVTFPMFEKVKAVGPDASPLYLLLTQAKGPPKWNFHKYLVDKHGAVVAAWPSAVEPSAPDIAQAIEAELARP